MDNKFNALPQKIQNITDIPEKIEENCNSYKTALLSNIHAADVNNHPRQLKVIIKNNITLHNAPESTAGTIDERNSDDKAFFSEACNSFCDDRIPTTSVLLARRLGKHKEDNTR